jgi:hypothetical protein
MAVKLAPSGIRGSINDDDGSFYFGGLDALGLALRA